MIFFQFDSVKDAKCNSSISIYIYVRDSVVSNFTHQREPVLPLLPGATAAEVTEEELTDFISGPGMECEEELPLWRFTLLQT